MACPDVTQDDILDLLTKFSSSGNDTTGIFMRGPWAGLSIGEALLVACIKHPLAIKELPAATYADIYFRATPRGKEFLNSHR